MYEAISAFLGGAPLPAPYQRLAVGAYRALCVPESAGTGTGLQVVLLAADDGAVYAPAPDGASPQEATLRRLRLRQTGTTLALRLPVTVTGGAPRLARFVLWASPAYLAAGGAAGAVWK